MDNILFANQGFNLEELLRNEPSVMIVADRRALPEITAFDLNGRLFRVDATEENKSLEMVARIAGWLIENDFTKDSLLVGIGGGIVTDLTAFIASVYKRGTRYALVPTTLLAQVDASIGGKSAVNLCGVKNVLGTITLPEWVLVDGTYLTTLSQKQLHNGMAEMIKSFVIKDRDAYEGFMELISGCKGEVDPSDVSLRTFIERAIRIKCEIVESDRYEKGERALLNFGHTLGHCIEAIANGQGTGAGILHGEAVGAGMIFSLWLSAREGVCRRDEAAAIAADLCRVGYRDERELMRGNREKLLHYIRNDKKCNKDFINFAFVRSAGDAVISRIGMTSLCEAVDEYIKCSVLW